MMILFSIAYAGTLVWLSAAVQHVQNLRAQGVAWVTGDRAVAPLDEGFSGRSARALRNNVESAAMYVPVAAAVFLLNVSTLATNGFAIAYMVVRASFTVAYWLKVNQLRSLSWAAGMLCILGMAGTALLGCCW